MNPRAQKCAKIQASRSGILIICFLAWYFFTVNAQGTIWTFLFLPIENFLNIFFLDKNNGWLTGCVNGENVILYTNNGGIAW